MKIYIKHINNIISKLEGYEDYANPNISDYTLNTLYNVIFKDQSLHHQYSQHFKGRFSSLMNNELDNLPKIEKYIGGTILPKPKKDYVYYTYKNFEITNLRPYTIRNITKTQNIKGYKTSTGDIPFFVKRVGCFIHEGMSFEPASNTQNLFNQLRYQVQVYLATHNKEQGIICIMEETFDGEMQYKFLAIQRDNDDIELIHEAIDNFSSVLQNTVSYNPNNKLDVIIRCISIQNIDYKINNLYDLTWKSCMLAKMTTEKHDIDEQIKILCRSLVEQGENGVNGYLTDTVEVNQEKFEVSIKLPQKQYINDYAGAKHRIDIRHQDALNALEERYQSKYTSYSPCRKKIKLLNCRNGDF